MYGACWQLSYLWDVSSTEVWDALKSLFGVEMQATRERLIWGRRVLCCIETLLLVLLGTAKDFTEYLFSLYYCCFNYFLSIAIDKAKSAI